MSGSKDQMRGQARALAKHGFVVFNINYRLVGHGGEFPADLIDVKDALAFVATKDREWHVDTSRLAAMGGSAGAHLSMMLGYTPDKIFAPEHYQNNQARVVAVVSWFGPTDFNGYQQKEKASNHKWTNLTNYLARAGENAPGKPRP